MNTIRFTSKALALTLLMGLAFEASATPVITVLTNAASRAATFVQPYVQPVMTKAGELVVKFTPQSMLAKTGAAAVLGGATGAAATAATIKPSTQVVEKVVEKTITPSTFAPFVAGAAFGLAIDGGKLAVKGAKKAYNWTTGSKIKGAAAIAGTTAATLGLAYAGYRFGPSIATLKSAADFVANNKLATAYQALQFALGLGSYETAKAGLASLISKSKQEKKQETPAQDPANCPDGSCPTKRQKSLVKKQGRRTPTTATGSAAKRQTFDNSSSRDKMVNGKQIAFYQVLGNNNYRAIERGKEKVKSKNTKLIRPDELPAGAIVINMRKQ